MPAAWTSSSAISASRGPTRSPRWPTGVAATRPTPAAMPMPSPACAGGRWAERVRGTLKRAVTLQPSENSQRCDPRVDLLKELADPVRLRVVDHLGNVGPATVSELAAGLRVTMPQLSNHLRRLREAGLVRVERTGRHAIYELADESLQALLPLLDRLTGRVTTRPPQPDAEDGRTCYDHLAGRLGVALYAALRERGALRDEPDGTVTVGDEGTLRALGGD